MKSKLLELSVSLLQASFNHVRGHELTVFSSSFPISFDANLCLATRQDDPQWSSFVYWSAISLVFAEDRGITQRLSPQMPEVNLFGPQFQFMFRDAVHSVGNHGQIYDRDVARYVTRDGRNMLNAIKSPGPQLYVLPGFDLLET